MRVPYKIFLVDGIPLFDEVPAGARYSKGYEGRFWTPRPVSGFSILHALTTTPAALFPAETWSRSRTPSTAASHAVGRN
jgi:hypothetical protein